MVNLDNIQTLEPINITTNISSSNFLDTAISSANTTTDGYYGLIIGIVIYVFIVYLSTRQDSLLALDLVKASVLGSGITLTFMIIMLALDMISSFQHLIWFGMIFIISLGISYWMREKE